MYFFFFFKVKEQYSYCKLFSSCLFSVVAKADFNMFGARMPISSTFTSVNSQFLVLMVF